MALKLTLIKHVPHIFSAVAAEELIRLAILFQRNGYHYFPQLTYLLFSNLPPIVMNNDDDNGDDNLLL